MFGDGGSSAGDDWDMSGFGMDALDLRQTARALRIALGDFVASPPPPGPPSRAALASHIRRAGLRAQATRDLIARRRFALAFQPVVTLADRQVHHLEALLRPAPVEGQTGSTQDFVTFSEAIGLAEALDGAVLDRVAETIDTLAGVPVAVNVSGHSLQSRAFRCRLIALAAMFPGRILIELTETAEIEAPEIVSAAIDRLRSAGMAVCLDDLGAGHAAFRYLRQFRVDYVKIDGTFVHGAASDARDRSFVASMLDMARATGARAIAEMVETEAQCAVMQGLGVAFGQGWLFGRPALTPRAVSRSDPAPSQEEARSVSCRSSVGVPFG